jgi:hypothetical protein
LNWWQCCSDGGADHDAEQVNERGRDRDRQQDGECAVAGGERHRHELALVAQFGDEDDAEAQ